MTTNAEHFFGPAADSAGGPARNDASVVFRAPKIGDGARLWQLATDSGTLDTNSMYSYLLWCRDFSGTSVVGCVDGSVATFVTGYLRPDEPTTLFVWQVATDVDHRGRGLARRALDALVDRVARHQTVAYLEATVTPGNIASARLFTAFASGRRARLTTQSLFVEADFAGAGHEKEVLFRIGPLAS
jgi:L-2,4-diaminobutyric acid acetyltransferase